MSDSIYPNGIDGYSQLPLAVDTVTRIDADSVNRLRNAIVNVETELGINPSGSYTDVRTRLDNIEGRVEILEENVTPPTPGDGGDVIIPDGGTIGGYYDSDVICLGQVTATAAVEVGNNLVVRGDFINDGGWPLTVKGSFHSQTLLFNNANPLSQQGNIVVDGEFTFKRIEFSQGGGTIATLSVGGNLTCTDDTVTSGIYASGINRSTPGLDIIVYGNLTITTLEAKGSPGNIIFPGGDGGYLTVKGSIVASSVIDLSGGDSANSSGGNGGFIDCSGNLSAIDVNLNGGEDSNGAGGNGGALTVLGTVTSSDLSLYGGRGFNGLGGDGGTVNISGNTSSGSLNIYGGRGDAGRGGDGGNVTINGTVTSNNLNTYGGRGTGAAGGNGGLVYIYGNSSFDDINMYGGLGALAAGGNGGLIYIYGDVSIDGDLSLSGGVGAAGVGGDGGLIFFAANTSVRIIESNGGNSELNSGGNGGQIEVLGNLKVKDITAVGGNSTSDSVLHRSGTGGSLTVGGDLLNDFAPGTIDLRGGTRDSLFPTKPPLPGTETPPNGGTIQVVGNINFSNIILSGGPVIATAINPHSAGSGGFLSCRGSITITSNIELSGGISTTSDSGYGGILHSYSDLHVNSLYMNGGESSGGNAGWGGIAYVKGNVFAKFIEAYGGNCTSTDVGHSSGKGGEIYISGNLIEQIIVGLIDGGVKSPGYIYIDGGDRTGTFIGATPSPGGLTPPDGGTLEVYGGVSFSEISISGGDVSTVNFNPHSAGNGGYFYCGLSTSIVSLTLSGGNSTISNAGNGGEINSSSSLSIYNSIIINGGDSSAGSGGDGGQLYPYVGDAHIPTLDFSGGSGIEGNGGNGGFLGCDYGNIHLGTTVNGSGGNCNSTDETHTAGVGGDITISGGSLFVEGATIFLVGGNRSGATTVSNISAAAPYGGTISINGGDLNCTNINISGGNITTPYPNGSNPDSGSIYVKGYIRCNQIIGNGGAAVGAPGGNGTIIDAFGLFTANTITLNGGNSTNSVLGGDATFPGAGGAIYFYSGADIGVITMLDGTGGVPAGGLTSLRLSGSCIFDTINMPNRANSRIYSVSNSPAILKVNSMPTKTTLNNSAGVATGSIAATLNSSIFIAGTSSTWFGIAGVAI